MAQALDQDHLHLHPHQVRKFHLTIPQFHQVSREKVAGEIQKCSIRTSQVIILMLILILILIIPGISILKPTLKTS